MAIERPPTIDPVAAARWQRRAPAASPWLHEEVARRMADRLEWIRRAPEAWADWQPVRGGMEGHRLVAERYPQARCRVVEPQAQHAEVAKAALGRGWWEKLRRPAVEFGPVPDGSVQMLWSNMLLHVAADPQALFQAWHRALAVEGFVMFSALGPDTVRELRTLYAALDWPPPSHDYTDMHDWGDMLVHGGFAEPVMDMERITLTFETPERLLAELRELGANLHPARFAALRGRTWRDRLHAALARELRSEDGRLALTFEVVYGHALKPPPRLKVQGEAALSVDDFRSLVRSGGRPSAGATMRG
ncbi:methyltransferase domain-containing protein [Ramlibacter sp.]|uniref:methyltransferase domain-containing protein n=1 Tax=Ramlibacter sp. TaxID=1917967 RepID=UPI003D0A4628